jgi:hypothetical protein
MHSLALMAYAFAAGLTLCGLAGATFELAAGRRLGFHPPFVRRERFAISLAPMVAAGPFMLANEVIAAKRAGAIDSTAAMLCAVRAGIWAMALGIVAVELALLVSRLLG